DPEKSRASGADLGLDPSRAYGSWPEMLEGERALPESERGQIARVVTPNHVHFDVALAFVEAGFAVVCDKPLVHTSEQAELLLSAGREHGNPFAVTYNYTGYPMIKEARALVRGGELGDIRKVVVSYTQGWLATLLASTADKTAGRQGAHTRAAVAGAMGDIGSH